MYFRPSVFRSLLAGAGLSLWLAAPVLAQHTHAHTHSHTHAHTHGVVALDVAVDADTLIVRLEAPLDSLVGFERAPRTPAERQRADAAVDTLKAGHALLRVDPAAGCTPGAVQLESEALGLGEKKSQGRDPHPGEHADLDATYTFKCERAADARFIELGLFKAFPAIRTVNAQVAAPQGQFKRTLGRSNARLAWGR